MTYTITSAPSRDLLFDSCKYAHDTEQKVIVGLTIAPNVRDHEMRIKVKILQISHESGTGRHFNVRGVVVRDFAIGDPFLGRCFTAYINTAASPRTGSLTFDE